MSKNSAKSAASGNRKTGSPAGKTSVASILTAIAEPKRQKLPLWTEWNENDVNAEKWDMAGKAKDPKGKPTSAQVSHGFEDPDPKFDYPASIAQRIDCFKRPSEIFDKPPFVVDDNNIDSFDLITPNEHLHSNETYRWIISQIHTLWDICKRDPKKMGQEASSDMSQAEIMSNKACAAGRLWRPWEHIYALNKVVKGPFIPAYNQHGKYVVRLYFLGSWRKLIIDDLMPVDEKGQLLIPSSSISGEIWPMILTKALLKIVSLDLNNPDSPTEFNDISVISCFTGWLPEPLPLRFGHINEVWKFLNETLPRYQWPENEKAAKTAVAETEDLTLNQENSEVKDDCDKDGGKDAKGKKTAGKPDGKQASGKDTKLDKNAKKDDKNNKKGKSTIDEPLAEENFAPDFPEIVCFASFTDLPLNKLSASTEVADRRERLRQYNLNHDFSNPMWITCTRDISLNPPPPPEIIPVWKTIRQRKKHVVPSDEPIPTIVAKPDQWVEIKSPYVGYKSSSSVLLGHNQTRSNSRFSRMRSRPQSGSNIQGIDEVDEFDTLEKISDQIAPSESPTELSKTKLDIHNEKLESDLNDSIRGKNLKSNTTDYKVKATASTKRESLAALDVENIGKPMSVASSAATGFGKKPNLQSGLASSLSKVDDEIKSAAPTENPAGLSEQAKQEQELKDEQKNKLWMDFDDFAVCFKSIIVYHKPSSFKFSEKYSDLRQVVPQFKQNKKEAISNQSQLAPLFDEKSPKLLFVDSLLPIELIISFSSLSRWYEQKTDGLDKANKQKKTESIAMDANETMSVSETVVQPPLVSGYLMAEPYLWKSLVTGQPLLRIHTTAIRSSFLSLPPGRHVLKFMISAPVGYHINVLSNTKFSLGDEEEIMPKLTDESCRFVDQALNIMKCLNDAVKAFNDPLRQKQSLDILANSISPLTDAYLNNNNNNNRDIKNPLTKKNLHEIFQSSLYEMLRKALPEAGEQEALAWRVFLADAITKDPFILKEKRPETSTTSRGSAKPKPDKKKSELDLKANKDSKSGIDKGAESSDERYDFVKFVNATKKENDAATLIQSYFKAHFTKKIFNSRVPGSPLNCEVYETLKKSLNTVEQNIHENSLLLFRTMFKINPEIMQYYSFYKDEWNRISYLDYNGSYIEQPTNNWLILFRDIFYANEQCLLLPKIYCNLNNCLLRVINNDTYKEIPKVFNKVSPYAYARNKRGYTIIAESREQPMNPGRWRLRLIGSSPCLIAPKENKPEIASAFDTKEIKEYYIPNDNNSILRYKVTVSEDHLSTLQITTSKPDVYLKLAVYDNGDEVVSVLGKGFAQIPAVIFQKDRTEGTPNEPSRDSRPTSKTHSIRGSVKDKSVKDKSRRSNSQTSTSDNLKITHSRSNSRQSIEPEAEEPEISFKPHKYIIEATVLKESWPLSPANWDFVTKLKETENSELKVFSKDGNDSSKEKAQNDQKAAAAAAAAKNAKAPTAKGKAKGTTVAPSRPVSSVFDTSKPFWTLKWVAEESTVDAIEIKKDTDRIEEIKSIKRAWESVEAGRAAKALFARTTFLKENMVKVDGFEEETESEDKPAEEQDPAVVRETLVSETSKIENKGKPSAKSDDSKGKAKDAKKKETDNKSITKSQQDITTLNNDTLINQDIDEILLQRPPTPPKPKVFLPPIDSTPFTKTKHIGLNYNPVLKDDNFIKEQDKQRKMEIHNFMQFKEQMTKFRDEEKKYRLYQKLKQIEDCETLQMKLDQARKEFIEPREAFRQVFLDAERKRLEDSAAQEQALASQVKLSDAKDKKKGSAGKDKKKK